MTAAAHTGRRLLAAGALAAALATGAAGCGASSQESNAYVDRVNIAQTRFASSFARLSREITTASSRARDRRTLRSIAAATDSTTADLRRIKPPESVKVQHRDLLDAISSYGDAIALAERGLSGGVKEAADAEARLAAETARTGARITNAITAINQKLRN